LRRSGQIAGFAVLVALISSALPAQAQTPGLSADPIGDLLANAARTTAEVTLKLKATLYHVGAAGVGARDSLGCVVSPMRTLAVDPKVIPRRTIVFIEETVGMLLPDGRLHDGLWYASDTGGAIKGNKIDLFTGDGRGSMAPFTQRGLNLAALTAIKVGTFTGCPPK
jgi:3D (Asp-Asp-Asp) domain-containing protein